ncbi:HAD hydrolase family protein [Roseisolibacter sp. H3M3-2]|uniref:KdsC family phosphatase n=1 Tax=Roseisolibacter sp. H3M3-2 TaxID=3031323 RepID=UPI0023DAFB0B|nr:HAD hydrolase family protein [Roseisolibacter sp. H3M3-2]MDF1502015.1 HAD hydrolase family protein [Roseisolibacter sp. H3M3-2]
MSETNGARPTLDADRARRVRWVGLDVDGVLTDGGIYLGDVAGARHEFKRYDIQDGLGILMMRMAGIHVAIVTGRVSESVRLRAEELSVDDLVQDPKARKLPALKRIAAARGITLDDMAFLGDDLPDVGVLRAVGLPVAVGNATDDARAAAARGLQLTRRGGAGAVREFAEVLLRARGQWAEVVERYIAIASADVAEDVALHQDPAGTRA